MSYCFDYEYEYAKNDNSNNDIYEEKFWISLIAYWERLMDNNELECLKSSIINWIHMFENEFKNIDTIAKPIAYDIYELVSRKDKKYENGKI